MRVLEDTKEVSALLDLQRPSRAPSFGDGVLPILDHMAQPKNVVRSEKTGAPTNRRGLVENEIYEHATRLFAEKGFASTTLQDIADALGVTRPAVYYYFKVKEAILARLLGEITQATASDVEEVARRADLSPSERLRTATRLTDRRPARPIPAPGEVRVRAARGHRPCPPGGTATGAVGVRAGRPGRRRDRRLPAGRTPAGRAGRDRTLQLGRVVAPGGGRRRRHGGRPGGDGRFQPAPHRRAPAPERGTDGALALLREDIDHLEQLLAAERRGSRGA